MTKSYFDMYPEVQMHIGKSWSFFISKFCLYFALFLAHLIQ
jgi:hypothetical protein